MERQVVITGMGAVTPLGLDVKSFWEAWCAGRSGIRIIDRFDVTEFGSQVGGLVEGFDPLLYMNRKDARNLDRYTLLAVAAANQAVTHSGLNGKNGWRNRSGVVIGTGSGGILALTKQIEVLRTSHPRFVSPFLLPMMLSNSAAAFLSLQHGLKGPSLCVSTACASGSTAMTTACNMIKAGLADVVLTGGTEAPIMPIVLAAFDSLKALTRDWNDKPHEASRPFDAMRSGFVLAEGAAVLVIEERCHALDRGAPILAEVAGWGETNDSYHMIAPAENGAGLAQAMRLAIAQANLDPGAVDSVKAHATSTPLGDQREAEAIRSVLGNRAEKVSVTAVKSAIGHTLGAAGAVSLVAAVMALQEGLIPATLNLTNPDQECGLDHVMEEPRRVDLATVMVNAAGFGGHNVSILVASPKD